MSEYGRIQNDDQEIVFFPGKKAYKNGRCTASCIVLSIFLFALVGGLAYLAMWIVTNQPDVTPEPVPCSDPCVVKIAETMPLNLTFPAGSPYYQSTYAIWKELIAHANQSIDIASYYWTLRGVDVYNDTSDYEGEEIFRELLAAGTTGGITIRIAENKPSAHFQDKDIKELVEKKAATVRRLDFDKLIGSGILHTKFWVVDGKHFYLGSANMDYRSLTQVKELGVGVFNCSCLAQDLEKLFEVYWYLGNQTKVPPTWPKEYSTVYNLESPMQMTLNKTNASVFIGSSPPKFCPTGRTSDIDGLLHVIDAAQKFVYIAVMDYIPIKEFADPKSYWDVIDAKLRQVAFDHKVEVRLLGSIWNHTNPDQTLFLKSLAQLGSKHFKIEVKMFFVPAYTPAEHKIPYGRVNHNKYMVTDNAAYIGTSNWSGTYFTSTGGASLVINQTLAQTETNASTVQGQLRDLFERDWNSIHALPVLNNTRFPIG